MQRTKSKLLSILLILVMLLSLLPTTALAADYPGPTYVSVDGGKSFTADKLYFRNGETQCSADSTNYNAHYDPTTGTLTLDGYNGGAIELGEAVQGDLTIKLMGNNTIHSTTSRHGVAGSTASSSITITADSGSNGKLTINVSNSTDYVYGIDGIQRSVTITGSADVTIIAEAKSTDKLCFGINSRDTVSILGNASVDIKSKVPENNTGSNFCRGINGKKVAIETDGTIMIDVTAAGDAGADSYGVDTTSSTILTKVGEMQVKWKKGTFPYVGGVISRGDSFDINTHAVNVDKDNCFASYRFGTPRTVTVENGTFTGPGVPNATKYSGKFLEGDTVSITPYEMEGNSGETIPFKEWTSSNVTLSSPTTEINSFTVPGEDVTVTAKHDPFDGAPSFTPTGTTNTEGTLTFKTVVKPGDGSEYFRLVKDGDQNDEGKYKKLRNLNPSTSTSPYEYSYGTTSSSGINQVEAGDYYVAEKLNGTYYWSEKFTVNYTAAPTPAANISLDKTGTVDFGSMEASYTAAPAAQTVTITNNGTAATGQLTIALDGANKTDFTLSKTSITDIAASGTDTFTVQPKAGLSAGIYNATVKVSGTGTGVTEQSFDVKFTVTAAATSIAAPTAKTGLVYNGTKQTGVNAGTGYTLGGTYEATNVGTTDYTATATLKTGYKWDDGSTGDKTITWNIGKRTPTVADFTFTAPADLTYDGNNKIASVTLNSPFTKSGAITVKYEKSGTAVTETKDVGTYTVKIDVAGGDNFNAGSGLTASAWTFSITPANQSAPTGLGVAAPTTSGGNGKITGTNAAMEYNTDAAATSGWTACSATETEVAPGTYYVRFKADSNHNAGTVSTALVVPAYSATKYTVTVTSDANGTASADKTINVAAGETVTLTATPNSGYVFDKWDNKTPAGLTIGADGKFTMPGANVSVKATFKGAALTGTASITGTLKYGQDLTATLTGSNNTGNLDYKWYQNGTTLVATNNTGKYTLRADDIGKTITVKITSSVQTGEIASAATATVVKADGPAAPAAFTLTFTPNADGTTFTATIPTVAGGEYSFDGTNYSATNSKTDCAANTSYTGHVRIAATSTHKASASTSSTQTSPKLTVATPTFTPNGASSFTGTQSVTISCTTVGATIHYTTDGTAPTASSPIYSTALSLTSTTTVKAIAVKAGMNNSATATATFTKYSGGGGGGWYYTYYTIKATAGTNGSISPSGWTSVRDGSDQTFTFTPDKGYTVAKVLVDGKSVGAVKSYTFKNVTKDHTIEAIFMKSNGNPATGVFVDVAEGSYYEESIDWAVEKGITNGVSSNMFAPNDPCTRAQIVTFLWRAAGSPAPKSMSSFTDVPAGAFYAKAVAWAVENGITSGTGESKFSPNSTCTRAQAVTFLYRASGSPAVSGKAEFSDVSSTAFYADAVAWAAKKVITTGIGGGLFGSDNDCTRGQIVTFLWRAMAE